MRAMSELIHAHRFTSPTVREIVEKRTVRTAPPERQKEAARQRRLVAASLLAMPRRS
jgi:hypothetical protein